MARGQAQQPRLARQGREGRGPVAVDIGQHRRRAGEAADFRDDLHHRIGLALVGDVIHGLPAQEEALPGHRLCHVERRIGDGHRGQRRGVGRQQRARIAAGAHIVGLVGLDLRVLRIDIDQQVVVARHARHLHRRGLLVPFAGVELAREAQLAQEDVVLVQHLVGGQVQPVDPVLPGRRGAALVVDAVADRQPLRGPPAREGARRRHQVRRAVGALDRDRRRCLRRAAIAVIDRVGEAVRRGLAEDQRVEGPVRIVGERPVSVHRQQRARGQLDRSPGREGRAADFGDLQRVAVDIGVVGQHGTLQHRVLEGLERVVARRGIVIDARDRDEDARCVGAAEGIGDSVVERVEPRAARADAVQRPRRVVGEGPVRVHRHHRAGDQRHRPVGDRPALDMGDLQQFAVAVAVGARAGIVGQDIARDGAFLVRGIGIVGGDRVGALAGDGDDHRGILARRAVPGGVGEAVGRLLARGQPVEGAVRIVAVAAVSIDRDQRAGGQRDRAADRLPADGRDGQRIAIRVGVVVQDNAGGQRVLERRAGIIHGRRGVIRALHGDPQDRGRGRAGGVLDGVGEQVRCAFGRFQRLEGAVGIIGESAVRVHRQQRAGAQKHGRTRRVIQPVDLGHGQCMALGIAVRAVAVIGGHVAGQDRVLAGLHLVVACHGRVVDACNLHRDGGRVRAARPVRDLVFEAVASAFSLAQVLEGAVRVIEHRPAGQHGQQRAGGQRDLHADIRRFAVHRRDVQRIAVRIAVRRRAAEPLDQVRLDRRILVRRHRVVGGHRRRAVAGDPDGHGRGALQPAAVAQRIGEGHVPGGIRGQVEIAVGVEAQRSGRRQRDPAAAWQVVGHAHQRGIAVHRDDGQRVRPADRVGIAVRAAAVVGQH